MVDMLYNWFICDFWKIDLLSLFNEFIYIFIFEYDMYFNCLWGFWMKFVFIRIIDKCLYILEEWCKIVNLWIYKIIWLFMVLVSKLFERLFLLKVVYFIWDFRVIL